MEGEKLRDVFDGDLEKDRDRIRRMKNLYALTYTLTESEKEERIGGLERDFEKKYGFLP